MNTRILHLLISISLFSITINVFSQSISRAFKNYEEGDLPRAFEILSKGIHSDSTNAAYNFGLALVYSNPKYDGKDYFKAWKHIMVADENFSKLSQDELKSMTEFLLNLESHKSNRPVRQKFDVHRKAIEDKLIKYVREENDMDMINEFIRDFPDSKFYENVIHIRNYIEFSKVAAENTLERYNLFIHAFPDAAQVPQAISARNRLAFEQARTAGKVDLLNNFLKNYPDAEQYLDALKLRNELAFQEAKNLNTIEAYESFIHSYPDAVQVSTALKLQKQLVFEKAMTINTFEAYADFLRRYPEAEQYVDIFNLMATTLGEKVMKEVHYPVQNMEWMKVFDNYGRDDHAAALCHFPDGTIAIAGTTRDDTMNMKQAWFIKLDQQGKMQWTKHYGNRIGVTISTAMVTPAGDIVSGGYAIKNPVLKDSSSWYIKLNPNGLKYYDKEAEGANILAMSCSPEKEYILAGNVLDSANNLHYWIMVTKESGRSIWSRTYSGKGELSSIKTDAVGRIYAAGGRWVTKSDADGYIQWEFIPETGDSLLSLDVLKTGEVFAAGMNRLKQLIIVRLTAQGKPGARYVVNSITDLIDVTGIRLTASNELYISANSKGSAIFAKFNDKGQLLNDLRFSSDGSNRIKDFAFSTQGGPLLLLENYRKATASDIILVKLK